MNRNTNPVSLLSMPRAELNALKDLNPSQRKSALNLLRRYYASILHPDRTGVNGQFSDVNTAIDKLFSSFSKCYSEAQPADRAEDAQLQRLREDNSYLRDQAVREQGEVEKLKLQIAALQSGRKRVENIDYKELWQEADRRHKKLFWEMRDQVGKWHEKFNEMTCKTVGAIIDILYVRASPEARYAGARFVMMGSKTSLQVDPDGQVTRHTLKLPEQKRGRLVGQLVGFISVPPKLRGHSQSILDVLPLTGKGIKPKFLAGDCMVTFNNSEIRISGAIKKVDAEIA